MPYDDLTIHQINEIKNLKNVCNTIGEWKKAMREKAIELGVTEAIVLQANRS